MSNTKYLQYQQKILSSQLTSFFLLQVALALRGVTLRVSRIMPRGPAFLTGKVNKYYYLRLTYQ